MRRCTGLLSAGVVTLMLTCLVGCNHGQTDAERLVTTAFQGFVYVGSFPVGDYTPPKHGYEPKAIPDRFESGRIYVFHYVGRLDDASFAVTELPSRLRAAGAKVLEAPSSTSDLPSVDPGDRAWRVVFVYGGLRGTIYNALDLELFHRGGLAKGGNYNSFVLRFDRG